MNAMQLRKVNAPLTPNLEDYKQKNKSKSRRKAVGIQPTNPPTPKITKPHLHLKPTNEKHVEAKEYPPFCPKHPDRPATRQVDPKNKCRICTQCYLAAIDDDRYQEEIQNQKSRELAEFREKIKGFGLKLQEAEEFIRSWGFHSQQNFHQQKNYVNDSFEELRAELDEKEREIISNLIAYQQDIKRYMNQESSKVEDMKKAIRRYIEDIESNYEDIIEELSYEQFQEIIDKYNSKIDFFQKNLEDVCVANTSLMVYIPRRDIERHLMKARVQKYPEPEETAQQNRTLQRYTTEKANLYLDGSTKGYLSQHQESINKISQHRQSRDRDYFCGRGHSAKENYNYDNRIFH